MGLQTANAQRQAYQSEERLDLRLRPQRIGVNCSIYSARVRCSRQNSMRAIACLRSIFAWSTPAKHDVQIMTTTSKSMHIKKYANEPRKKKFIRLWQHRQPVIDFLT